MRLEDPPYLNTIMPILQRSRLSFSVDTAFKLFVIIMKLSSLLSHVLVAATALAAPQIEDDLARRTTISPLHGQTSALGGQSHPGRRGGRPSASSLENITNNVVEGSTNVRTPQFSIFLVSILYKSLR